MKLWLTMLLFAWSYDVWAVTLQLKDTVWVEAANISLADVVENRKALPADMQNLVLAHSPRFGVMKKLSLVSIRQALRKSGYRTEVSGPEMVVVRADFKALNPDWYRDIAKKELATAIRDDEQLESFDEYELALTGVGKLKPLYLPQGRYTFAIDKITPQKINRRMFVNGSLSVDGEVYQSLQFEFDIKIYAQAWQLKNTAQQHDRVASFVERKTVDIVTDLDQVLLTENIDELRFSYEVVSGSLLKRKQVENIPLIESGSEVMVVTRAGMINILAHATAKSDGGKGDVIQLYRKDENKSFTGKVMGDRTVVAGTW